MASKKPVETEARRTTRPKLDLARSINSVVDEAQGSADKRFATNRFAAAQALVDNQPTAITSSVGTHRPTHTPVLDSLVARTSTDFEIAALEVGKVYAVPLALIDPNPVGARHFYRLTNVEDIVESFTVGEQDVAANGFVKGGRIELFDGGTRLRAARSAGLATLDVKIDPPPLDLREQFKRSRDLNDQRSQHTQLDLAVNIERLISEGIYATADECGADLDLSKSEVSMYRRVAKIPERLLQKMNDHDKTSGLTIPYEISGIFTSAEYLADASGDRDRLEQIAEELIEEIQSKDLSREQTKALLAAKIQGPKSRLRAETSMVKYGNKSGSLKVFASRGQVEFLIKGLEPSELLEVQERIIKALGSHPKES